MGAPGPAEGPGARAQDARCSVAPHLYCVRHRKLGTATPPHHNLLGTPKDKATHPTRTATPRPRHHVRPATKKSSHPLEVVKVAEMVVMIEEVKESEEAEEVVPTDPSGHPSNPSNPSNQSTQGAKTSSRFLNLCLIL